METIDGARDLGRRDWIKLAALGGAAACTTSAARAETVVTEPIAISTPPAKKVRGVVFMVSDGMSPGVLLLAEHLSHLVRKRGTAWTKLLKHPSAGIGLMDTGSANSLVTDSSAASSAWGSGQRINNGAVNVAPNGKHLDPIASVLSKKGVRIGLVSTATITHATPAGFAAVVPSRGDEQSIAPQYLNRVDVVLGGGAPFFDRKSRGDKRDLAGEFASNGYGIARDRAALLECREKKLLGLFTNGHLPYEIDRMNDAKLAERVPTLAEMSDAAVARFLESDAPFLLQIEGARIDHAAHLNDIAGLLWDQLAFDQAVEKVLERVGAREDILVVLTSDHGNSNPGLRGMGSSYSNSTQSFARIARITASHERLFADWNHKRGNPGQLAELVATKLGFELKDDQAAVLHDCFEKRPIVEWNEQLSNPEGILGQLSGNHTGIGWTGTTHTADPTLVTAVGPQAHRFAGMVRNTDVFGHLVEMLS
jgi:alkaline phosphatase